MCSLVLDDPSSVYRETPRTAARRHVCGECGMPIAPGTRYVELAGLQDGSWWGDRAHPECLELTKHLATTVCRGHGWAVGSRCLRDEVREHMHEAPEVLRMWRDVLRARRAEGVWPAHRLEAL